jgi:hypothetical protein
MLKRNTGCRVAAGSRSGDDHPVAAFNNNAMFTDGKSEPIGQIGQCRSARKLAIAATSSGASIGLARCIW